MCLANISLLATLFKNQTDGFSRHTKSEVILYDSNSSELNHVWAVMYVNAVTQKVMLISCWMDVYEWKKLIVLNPFLSTSFFTRLEYHSLSVTHSNRQHSISEVTTTSFMDRIFIPLMAV